MNFHTIIPHVTSLQSLTSHQLITSLFINHLFTITYYHHHLLITFSYDDVHHHLLLFTSLEENHHQFISDHIRNHHLNLDLQSAIARLIRNHHLNIDLSSAIAQFINNHYTGDSRHQLFISHHTRGLLLVGNLALQQKITSIYKTCMLCMRINNYYDVLVTNAFYIYSGTFCHKLRVSCMSPPKKRVSCMWRECKAQK